MGKRKKPSDHWYKRKAVNAPTYLTGSGAVRRSVFISYADDDLYTINYDRLIREFTKGDTVGSAVRRSHHRGRVVIDTNVHVLCGAGMVRREPEIPSGGDRLLTWIVPPDRLEAILGDLAERFRTRARSGDEQAALVWYSRQLRWTTWHEILRLLPRIFRFAHLLQKVGLL